MTPDTQVDQKATFVNHELDASEHSPRTEAAVPAVVQAFSVIETISRANRPLRLAEVVTQTDLPKTTAYRLLKTLTDLGVLTREDQDFRMGSRMARYGNDSVPSHIEMIGMFYALVGDMHNELDETIQLAILTPPDVTFLAFVNSNQSVRLVTRVGRRLPAHASATGKAILAFSPQTTVDRALSTKMNALTEWTITDSAVFRRQLNQTRSRGWATESQESAPNLSCVAVPVIDTIGTAVAAVTVCLPVAVLPAPRQRIIAQALSRFVNDLQRRLGY